MDRSEKETLIIVNRADLDEGFFIFGTSQKTHFQKLCKRVRGRDKLIDVKHTKSRDGKSVWWECRVPCEFLSRSTFGVKSMSKSEAAIKRGNSVKKIGRLSLKKEQMRLRTS
jgi:hypothetical protein